MKKTKAKAPQNQKNIIFAISLAVIAGLVGVSVFWWRLSHKMAPMPQGSVYGSAYLPVALQQAQTQPAIPNPSPEAPQ